MAIVLYFMEGNTPSSAVEKQDIKKMLICMMINEIRSMRAKYP